MVFGIRRILELACQEPVVFPCEFFGFADHAAAALGRWREDDLGTEAAHDLAPLYRKGVCHRGDKRMAFRRAYHRERDTGVARGSFYHRLPRPQLTALFGIADDREGEAVLYRSHRVEGFDLDVNLDIIGRHTVEAHDRRVADGLENIVVDHPVVPCCRWAAVLCIAESVGNASVGGDVSNDQHRGRFDAMRLR